MAAGLTVARAQLEALEVFMRERLAASTGAARTQRRSISTGR